MNDSLNALLLPDERLLHETEIRLIPPAYREYYKTRRQNFFGVVDKFPEIWDYYQSLDTIMLEELTDLNTVTDVNSMFPLMLILNTHAKVRLSIELAFSGCIPEAHSLMRDAVEFIAHANLMMRDPTLQAVWLNKDEEEERFREAFERNKKKGLFANLPDLHKIWGELSETGSHATITSICDRFVIEESDTTLKYRLNYCGMDERTLLPSIFVLLLCFSTIEKLVYDNFKTRLQFDEPLVQKRLRCEVLKEELRRKLISCYDIKPPSGERATG